MKIIVSFTGHIGGTGKTELAKAFSKEIAKMGHQAFYMDTNPNYEESLPFDDGKKYVTLDARTKETFNDQLLAFQEIYVGNNELAVLVIDGGLNRVDEALSEIADAIIIPFRNTKQDKNVADRFKSSNSKSFGLPNFWPAPDSEEAVLKEARDCLNKHSLFYEPGSLLEPIYKFESTIDDKTSSDLTLEILNKIEKYEMFTREKMNSDLVASLDNLVEVRQTKSRAL